MARPLWFVNILKKIYRLSTKIPWILKIPVLKTFFEELIKYDKAIFLTKDRVIEVNQEVEKVEDLILPSKVAEYFVRKAKHVWMMNFCFCRDALQCKHYPIELGCLFLGDAVLGINPKLGRLVSKEEALKYLERCRKAGLIHQIGRNKVDSMWLNVKPYHKLMVLCSCCECCCLAQVLAKAPPKIKAISMKMPGVNVKVTSRCTGCGTCTQGVCVFDAISLYNKHAHISADCRACGRCVEKCPNKAIELSIDDKQFIDKSIKILDKIVDIT